MRPHPRLKDLGAWSSGGTPPKDQEAAWQGDLPWLSAKDINRDALRAPTTFITENAARQFSRVVPAGSLLMIVRGMALAHGLPVVLTERRVAFNQDLRALIPRPEHDPRFLHYALRGHRSRLGAHIDRAAHGTAKVVDSVFLERIWAPARSEQSAIADVLDHERERISRFSNRLERASELLHEIHAASSSEAFGDSSPYAKVPVKNLIEFQEGPGIMAVDFREEGVPLLRIRNLQRGSIDLHGCDHLDPTAVQHRWARFRVREGDLLVSASATSRHAEAVSIVPRSAVGAIPYTGLIRIWARASSLDPDYLRCFLGSSAFWLQVEAMKTGVGVSHWGPSHLKRVRIPVPGREDQAAVASRLLCSELRIRASAAVIRSSLEALTEYRDALITEAVTGQLDVTKMSDAQMDERLHEAVEAG